MEREKKKERIKDNNENLQALVLISTKPDKFRTSTIDYKIIEEIKIIRQEYYRLGKYKVKCIFRRILHKRMA